MLCAFVGGTHVAEYARAHVCIEASRGVPLACVRVTMDVHGVGLIARSCYMGTNEYRNGGRGMPAVFWVRSSFTEGEEWWCKEHTSGCRGVNGTV